MGAIDIEPPAVGQDFVQLPVIVRPRPFPLAHPPQIRAHPEGDFHSRNPTPHGAREDWGSVRSGAWNWKRGRRGIRIAAGDAKFGFRAEDTDMLM